jgi:dissimilatory sulfite reductase (desulfoviridin) alpha/beta subunit
MAAELEPEMESDFRVELSGCQRDCRLSLERADLGVVMDLSGEECFLYLGGRHRPFGPMRLPRVWKVFRTERAWYLVCLMYRALDLWRERHKPEETMAELADRLGQDRLDKLTCSKEL